VEATGPLTTVQDTGRPGYAALGVPRSGALDRPAAALAARLVGLPPRAAVLEVTLGGLRLAAPPRPCWVAVTGARAPVTADGRARPHAEAFWWATGPLELGAPADGVRSYVALGGGLEVAPVLGSRSTDVLAGLGPAPLAPGDVLPVGDAPGTPVAVDVAGVRRPGLLRLHPGPRADWVDDALERLCRARWRVLPASNRVGLRLTPEDEALPRAAAYAGAELPSEGMVLGAVQVPPDGGAVVFLSDHPTTGGYPVVAVVDETDLWQAAQARPGERVGFTRA